MSSPTPVCAESAPQQQPGRSRSRLRFADAAAGIARRGGSVGGRRCLRGHRRADRGQETLQAILVVAFVLLPVLAAILTFGSLVHAYIGAQAAAAAGARSAGSAGGFGPEQLRRIDDELRTNGLDPANCAVDRSADEVALDQPISVTVRCPHHIGIPFLFERDVELTSTFVAHGEVNR